jgi:heme/copper-type cytochrome/quinol oxidase subunit 3
MRRTNRQRQRAKGQHIFLFAKISSFVTLVYTYFDAKHLQAQQSENHE